MLHCCRSAWLVAATFGLGLTFSGPARAADLYWSGDGASQGGSGTWDTVLTRWGNVAEGPYDDAWNNSNNDTAIFGGTVGTVTLGEDVNVGGLQFTTANYAITGGTITLASGAMIHSNVGSSNSNDPAITSALAGSDGFTKTGSGWLGLEATTSGLNGTINVQEGTLYARFESLGSANLVFTGNSTFTKVYNAPGTASTSFAINDGVTASIGGSTFYYNFTTTGALTGNSSAKLVIQNGGNTEKNFNSTSNTFAGELTLAGGGTADGGQRAGFMSLADSNQKIIINDALFRLNNGGVSMNFANRQLEMTSNARLDNDSTNASVTMSFAQDLSVLTGNNGRILYLTGVNTGNNTFSGVIGNSSNGSGATQVRKTEAGTWILGADNTYTGKTTVDNGTLVVGSLKDIGTASSIGAGSTLQLGYFTATGTLSYVGAGDSTNRPLQINDYTAGTGNTGAGRILNNGTGALTFTASTFVPTNEVVVANRSLQLGGTYAGGFNEIQGVIQDIAPIAGNAVVSVVKQNDASLWALNATNTYTGATTINGGVLAVTGSGSINDTSGITLNGGTLNYSSSVALTAPLTITSGTISGNGTINQNLTINGSIAPGNSIGVLTVGGNVTWNGSAATPWVFELDAGDSADLLAITSGDFLIGSGSGGTDFVFDFAGSTAAGTFDLVTWTGNTTFTETDFSYTNYAGSNAGTFAINGSTLQFIAVPEPATLALAGLGLAGVTAVVRRARQARDLTRSGYRA